MEGMMGLVCMIIMLEKKIRYYEDLDYYTDYCICSM